MKEASLTQEQTEGLLHQTAKDMSARPVWKKKHNTVGIKNLQRYNENSFYSVGKVVSLFDTNLLELLYIHGDIMTPGNN